MPPSILAQHPRPPWPLLSSYLSPSTIVAEQFRHRNLSYALKLPLDRVNVLGKDDGSYGHTGCVNALSWSADGQILLSGGDDTTVRIWRMDQTDTIQEYPFVCRAVISTGHRANIFNVAQLPCSTRIATVAGDKQVRILDAETVFTTAAVETECGVRSSSIRVLRCHSDRVKRLVTEDSPNLFLSVAEDGTVRQHDLRSHHVCREGSCPTPLVKFNFELSTISLSPLTPYQFVVAGDSPYGYLFDRRHTGRAFMEEWGAVPGAGEGLTSCVRRFGRPAKTHRNQGRRLRDHITGVRVSSSNGHEVLITYSSDAVYLYSTKDDPEIQDSMSCGSSPILTPNPKRRRTSEDRNTDITDRIPSEELNTGPSEPSLQSDDLSETSFTGDDEADDDGEGTATLLDDPIATDDEGFLPDVPLVFPRMRYSGARNVATTKDVNFLGPRDECIVSGSDDGNFFLWDKESGNLHGIYEGDGSIVNVIEGHPYLPLLAVSGIDTTVKLFAPANSPSLFSRTSNADRIVARNARLNHPRIVRSHFATLLAEAIGADQVSFSGLAGCTNQ
ncbi:hypothetical protein AMATHDRAFT_1806 [Amanita thiersii Skay4041]|uniref:WD40 repeat-like protein n=1 Tax=Amanita thiersii Skay4041 TaxID=703135 RepID=A0A2A9NQD3_9AGAR|nr:hypothetical protein AMATHDRAFT_1806 [Amanita thiersii Skay4041]